MSRLDQPLRELTGYQLRRATSSSMTKIANVFARFGLRRTTFSTLALIVESPGLRQNQLAEALDIERPNLVRIIDELENAGLVVRKKAKNDRRAYAMQATLAGRKHFQEALRAVREFDTKLTEGLTAEEVKALHHALMTIESNAKQMEATDELQVSRA